jgi:hypothetical protein
MSEPTNETQAPVQAPAPASNLQELRAHHAHFTLQRDQAQVTYQQLVGAIFACEMMIKNEEEKLKKQFAEQVQKDKANADKSQQATDNQGAIDDGQAKSEGTEQAA